MSVELVHAAKTPRTGRKYAKKPPMLGKRTTGREIGAEKMIYG